MEINRKKMIQDKFLNSHRFSNLLLVIHLWSSILTKPDINTAGFSHKKNSLTEREYIFILSIKKYLNGMKKSIPAYK